MKKLIIILITIINLSILSGCDRNVSKVSVYENWLLSSYEEIGMVKITKEPVILNDFSCVEYIYTTEKTAIESIFNSYKSLRMRKVESFEQTPGSEYMMVEFYYSDDIVNSIHIIDGYYSNNDEHFKLNSIPQIKEEYATHTYTISSYMSEHSVYQYNYDNDTVELVTKISNLDTLEFEKYTGQYLPENDFTHYIETEFGNILILSEDIFYLNDEVYHLVNNQSFYEMF